MMTAGNADFDFEEFEPKYMADQKGALKYIQSRFPLGTKTSDALVKIYQRFKASQFRTCAVYLEDVII